MPVMAIAYHTYRCVCVFERGGVVILCAVGWKSRYCVKRLCAPVFNQTMAVSVLIH